MALKSLTDRMKGYEQAAQVYLPSRLPVMVRIDGNHFSNFTKNLEKPFDKVFLDCMVYAAAEIMKNASGAVFAYTQSDELSILLRNDQTLNTEPWLGNRTDKIISHCASMMTLNFYREMADAEYIASKERLGGDTPTFDARVWVLPPSEVVNYFVHRQQDCVRNSISAAAYYELKKLKKGVKMLHGKNMDEQQEILFQECGINWAKYDSMFKNGTALYFNYVPMSTKDGELKLRRKLVIDKDLPNFASNREFITKHLE